MFSITIWLWLTVCHGKSPFFIGKPSISIRAIEKPWLVRWSKNDANESDVIQVVGAIYSYGVDHMGQNGQNLLLINDN